MQLTPKTLLALFLAASVPATSALAQDFEPDWKSLNARRPPAWFGEAKFGIFVHWGVYSVPSYSDPSTYAEWYRHWVETGAHDGLEQRFHAEHYGADFQYQDFGPLFEAKLFDPEEWAGIFARSGARYVVLTSKHHDGYCLWPSDVASQVRGYPWNSAEVGPKRDVVGELTQAVRAAGLRMGLYYSFLEWGNPLFDADLDGYVNAVVFPQIKDLVTRYAPDIFWPDGEWEHPDTTWRGAELLAWLYNESGVGDDLVVNDRWGKDLRGKVGDFYTSEYGSAGAGARSGRKPWEESRGIGRSYGFNRAEGYDSYMGRTEAVRALIETVAGGGNFLLDVGPTADGRIPLIMQDRLFAIGRFLEVNGEAIHGTHAGPFERLPWGTSTRRGNTVYLFVYDWPRESSLIEFPGLETVVKNAYVLSDPERRRLPVIMAAPGRPAVHVAGLLPDEHATVLALELAGPPIVNERFTADSDRVVRLAARFGEVGSTGGGEVGSGLSAARFERATLTNHRGDVTTPDVRALSWTDPEALVKWEPVVMGPGPWTVELVYSCAPGAEGSTYVISMGDATVQGKVEPTSGITDFVTRPVGTIQVGATGEVEVALRVVATQGAGPAMHVQAVHLAPLGSRR